MIDLILTKILQFFINLGYPGLFISSLGVFPTEIVMSVLAIKGFNLYKIALVVGIGEVLGAYPVYLLGFIFTGKKIYKWIDKNGKYLKINKENFEKNKDKLKAKSYWYVLFTRFVPWVRVVVGVAGGFLRMNIFLFSLAVFVGTYIYSFLIAYFSFKVGTIDVIKKYLRIFDKWIVIIVIGYLVISLIVKNRKKISKWISLLKKK